MDNIKNDIEYVYCGGRHAKMISEQGTGCCVDNTAVGALFMPCSMATGTRSQHMFEYIIVCVLIS